MLFGVFSNMQNWHAKYNVAQSELDLSFLDENVSFTLTFNTIALIMVLEIERNCRKKDKYLLFV